MDENLRIPYGTQICIKELNQKYHKFIVFKVGRMLEAVSYRNFI